MRALGSYFFRNVINNKCHIMALFVSDLVYMISFFTLIYGAASSDMLLYKGNRLFVHAGAFTTCVHNLDLPDAKYDICTTDNNYLLHGTYSTSFNIIEKGVPRNNVTFKDDINFFINEVQKYIYNIEDITYKPKINLFPADVTIGGLMYKNIIGFVEYENFNDATTTVKICFFMAMIIMMAKIVLQIFNYYRYILYTEISVGLLSSLVHLIAIGTVSRYVIRDLKSLGGSTELELGVGFGLTWASFVISLVSLGINLGIAFTPEKRYAVNEILN